MKQKINLKQIGQRTKAIDNNGKILKTIPKPFIYLVEELGFIDIRGEKQTLSEEERLLIVLYDKTSKYKDVPNFKDGLENIEIESKYHVTTTGGDEYYSIKIKNAMEIKVKFSEWNKLNKDEKEVRRWA